MTVRPPVRAPLPEFWRISKFFLATREAWPEAGRDTAGTYYSPLADINRTNVRRLGMAWDDPLETHRGLEATSLVVDGVLYVSGNFGRVYALDAATGRERWTYLPDITPRSGAIRLL